MKLDKRPREATTYEERQNRLQYGMLTDQEKEVHNAYRRGSLDSIKWTALIIGIGIAVWIFDATCTMDTAI